MSSEDDETPGPSNKEGEGNAGDQRVLFGSGGQKKGKGKAKGKLKVKSWNPLWLHRSIKGQKAAFWLKPDPKNPGRGLCKICPVGTSFSLNEGWRSISQHGLGSRHLEHVQSSQTNPNFKQVSICFILSNGEQFHPL